MNWLISLLTGPLIGAITGPILEAYKAKLAAVNSSDQLAVTLAMKEIEADIAARAEATKVLQIESGHWWMWMPRCAVQWSFSIFVCKVVVWDTCLGWGTTPSLGGDVGTWAGWVMTMWFGGRTLEKVARIFKR